MQENLRNRGYIVITDKDSPESLATERRKGWHAEGRIIEWAFRNNYKVEAMGVSQNLCPECNKDVSWNKIKTVNIAYPDDYYDKNPKKKRPAKRPTNRHPDCE